MEPDCDYPSDDDLPGGWAVSGKLPSLPRVVSRNEGNRNDGFVYENEIEMEEIDHSLGRTTPSLGRTTPSCPSTELDQIEDDPELSENLNSFLRKRSMEELKKHKGKRASIYSLGAESGCEQDQLDYVKLFTDNDQSTPKAEILQKIKLQKDIIAKLNLQPWPIQHKLKTHRLAKAYVEKYEGRLSKGHGYQEAGAKYWRRFKREFVNFISLFKPWEMRIKKIESHFGSAVASYFVFLRWLFGVNMILTVVVVGFIVIPELLVGEPFGSQPHKSIPESEQDKALDLKTIWDFEGYLKYSVMFYGYYSSTRIIGGIYRLPLAYFLTTMSTIGICFVIILRRMAYNARLNKMSDKNEQYAFNWKLFTSWDFTIGNSETARNKCAEIVTSFRESIIEEQEKAREENRYLLIFLRILANILVIIVLGSSTYAILLVVERSSLVEERMKNGEEVGWWDQNEVSMVMSLITALYPNIFDLIGLMEKYHPRINLRWQLARILVLYLLNLYTLLWALYQKYFSEDTENNTIVIDSCSLNATSTVSPVFQNDSLVTSLYDSFGTTELTNCSIAVNVTSKRSRNCWETSLGQEFFKLTVFDLITTVGTIILIDFVRGMFVRYMNKCWCWDLELKFPEYGEFKVAENLLHLIYNQAMIWMGTFFAPMLTTLNIVKMLIMLYTRSWAVIVCNIPHERVFKASRSNNFYFALLLIMLFLVTLPVGFLLVSVEPSTVCGPYSGLERAYFIVTNTIDEEFPEWMSIGIDYIASPGVIIPCFVLLLMGIYYLVSLVKSLKEANNELKEQLRYERTEEKRRIYKMADGGKDGKDSADTVNRRAQSNLPQPPPHSEMIIRSPPSVLPQPLPQDMKIIRIPGMTKTQALELKNKNPGIQVVTVSQAKQLNLLPETQDIIMPQLHTEPPKPPPKPAPKPAAYSRTRAQISGPPVAVVQGKQLSLDEITESSSSREDIIRQRSYLIKDNIV